MSESSSSSNPSSPSSPGVPAVPSQSGPSPVSGVSQNSSSFSGSNPSSGSGPASSQANIAVGRLDSIQLGDVIADKYRVDQVLGKGGMGLVVAAQHIQLDERVAIKFLRLEGDTAPEFHQRFVREAQVSAKLRSEHVVKVRDFGVLDDGTPYMVMEYLEGTDLRKLLKQFGKLPVDAALGYVAQACEGLAEAHAIGVVHRDMKPSNLYLSKRPDGSDLVKILDFGVAKMVQGTDRDELTAAGMLLGSPRYMSPEQLKGARDIDGRADVWSVGAILYELLVGRAPFLAQTTAALCMKILGNEPPASICSERSDVPPELEAVILHCLEREVEKRMPDVGTLCMRLAQATGNKQLEVDAKRVVAVLERRAMQQTGTYSTMTNAEHKGLMVGDSSVSVHVGSSHASMASGASWTSSGRLQKNKRTLAVAALAGALVIGAVVLFAAFRGSAETPNGAGTQPSATATATTPPSATAAVTQQPSATALPTATQSAPQEAVPEAGPDKGGKKPPVYTGPPVKGGGKTPPPPATTTTPTATPPPTTTRPPVNPLEDRQ